MKQRIISAIIAIALLVPILIVGGNIYKAGVIALGILGLLELIKAKENINKIPIFMKVITIYFFAFNLLNNISNNSFSVILSLKNITLYALVSLLALVLYSDDKKYNMEDATYLFFCNIFLTIGFGLLMSIREYNVYYLLMVLLITISSDTFALITGSLIGKNKFCPNISPNKTVEGFFGGLIFCLVICVPLYITIFNYTENIFVLIALISVLSIMSTLGDLVFSAIKRYFKIKDYGKIMPGHGGVMDRMDSFLFVLITLYIIITYFI